MMARNAILITLLSCIINKSSALDNIMRHPIAQKAIQRARELQFIPGGDICMLYNQATAQQPDVDDGCTCEMSLTCRYEDLCGGDENGEEEFCFKSLSVNMEMTDAIYISICADYAEGGYEEICSQLKIGKTMQVEECTSATYGGKQCSCELCDGGGVDMDCSEWNPQATTRGCSDMNSAAGAQGFAGMFGASLPQFQGEEQAPAEGTDRTAEPIETTSQETSISELNNEQSSAKVRDFMVVTTLLAAFAMLL